MVTFEAGVTQTTVSVPITDDSAIENNEMFTASLSSTETNVTIGDGTATITILDSDG